MYSLLMLEKEFKATFPEKMIEETILRMHSTIEVFVDAVVQACKCPLDVVLT